MNSVLERQSTKEAQSDPRNLAQVLSDLQILPYTLKSVKKYKRRLALKHFAWSIPAYLFRILVPIVAMAGITLIISTIIGAVFQLLGSFSWIVGLITLVSVFIMAGGVPLLCHLDKKRPTIYKGYWRRFSVYQPNCWNSSARLKCIPEFARATAKELIESRCPPFLFIEELYLEKIGVADPFLIAVDTDGNEYYLEVWDEPGYKKEY
jgi:hypothetical protein